MIDQFIFAILSQCYFELIAGIAAHDREYPYGDWKTANDRIGRSRMVAIVALKACGAWPYAGPAKECTNVELARLVLEAIEKRG